jgi:protein-S-isoprenylcysteine O-methyltransferase Ste14
MLLIDLSYCIGLVLFMLGAINFSDYGKRFIISSILIFIGCLLIFLAFYLRYGLKI